MADPTVSPSDASFDDAADAPLADDAGSETPTDDAADGQAGDAPDAAAPDAAASADVDRLQDRLVRLTAEYDNYRRRSASDRDEAVRQGRLGVLLPILEVYDDLRRSLDASRRAAKQDAGSASFDALSQGIELVFQKFADALDKVGVTTIDAVGQPFSEDEHEALMQQPSDEAESGTVLAEVQPGYRLGDRVVRHARVIVAE